MVLQPSESFSGFKHSFLLLVALRLFDRGMADLPSSQSFLGMMPAKYKHQKALPAETRICPSEGPMGPLPGSKGRVLSGEAELKAS